MLLIYVHGNLPCAQRWAKPFLKQVTQGRGLNGTTHYHPREDSTRGVKSKGRPRPFTASVPSSGCLETEGDASLQQVPQLGVPPGSVWIFRKAATWSLTGWQRRHRHGAVGVWGRSVGWTRTPRGKRRSKLFDEAAVTAAKVSSRFSGNFLTKTVGAPRGSPAEPVAATASRKEPRGAEKTSTRVSSYTRDAPVGRARHRLPVRASPQPAPALPGLCTYCETQTLPPTPAPSVPAPD